MPLEDLLETIETLRARIRDHGPLLSQNETRTRYALIDPLLWGVGWDTEDPAQVVPEYALAPKSADYALLGSDGRPTMIMEAKRLDRPLRDGLSQSIAYCVEQGTPYFCVTDGRRWAIYETFRQVPVDKKLVTEFDVLKDSPAEVCLKALALWRPAVDEGLVREGETPLARGATKSTVIEEQVSPQWECPECEATIDESETRRIAGHKAVHTRQSRQAEPPTTHPNVASSAWTPLDKLGSVSGTDPVALFLPLGQPETTTKWVPLVSRITEWLVEAGHLKESQLPLRLGPKRYFLSTEPIHPTGKKFVDGRQVGSLWLEAHLSHNDKITHTCNMIRSAGMNPADFKVRLAD